jgi:DNA-binding response OmpR family regulator
MDTRSRLALIDDDRAWRETLAEYLEAKGFEVYPAEDGPSGLDLVDGMDIRLAVIDYHLGEMDGLQLLRTLQRTRRPITAFLTSSDDDPTLPIRAMAEGAQAFLSKTTPPGDVPANAAARAALGGIVLPVGHPPHDLAAGHCPLPESAPQLSSRA